MLEKTHKMTYQPVFMGHPFQPSYIPVDSVAKTNTKVKVLTKNNVGNEGKAVGKSLDIMA